MAAGRIVIPNYMPCLDITGGPVAGARLYFYENNTTDLQSVYTSAALTVAHTNPVIANAAGVFPSIFADLDALYSVSIRTADDVPIGGLRDVDNVQASVALAFADIEIVTEDVIAAALEAVSEFPVTPVGGPAVRPLNELLGNGYDNTPLLEWAGKRALWLGTSIPHQGAGVDGYPERVGERLKMAAIVNNAWSGSHASYAGEAAYAALTTDAQRTSHIVALSMTEADRLTGLATYGSGSAYSDTFNPIILASQQTADYRIKNAFATTAFDVVFLDHNHNDRDKPIGTLTPTALTVTGVTKGATTVVALVSIGTLAVGDGIVLQIAGIPKLAYCAARVQSIAGNNVTIGINSSGYAGTFTSGTASEVDRNTLYGSFDFLLHYIRWAALDAGRALPIIILSSAPSEFTGNAYSSTIYPNARAIQAFAVARGLTMFDVATSLKVAGAQNAVLLPDGVHPTTPTTRAVFANHWAQWLTGGAIPLLNDDDYIARGPGVYRNQREIEYSDWYGGSTTPAFVVTGVTNIITEDFVSIADWTVVGAATTITAPWNGALKALQAASVANAEPFIVRSGLTSTDAVEIAFPLYIPTLPTATVGQVKSASLFRIAGPSGIWLVLNLVTTSAGTILQVGVFTLTGNAGYKTFNTTFGYLSAATLYDIKLSAVQETATRPGTLLLTVNGNLAFDGPILTGDLAQANVSEVVIGIQASNMGSLTVNYGPLTYGSLNTPDYSARLTTDLQTPDGLIVSFVNGKATSVAAQVGFTAANIASAAHAVNTVGKRPLKQVWDTTNHRLMVTEGSTATSPWYVADGSVTVTPA